MLDKKLIQNLAHLARLNIAEDEAQDLSVQLGKALSYFEQISKIKTDGIDPLMTPTQISSYWREDVVKQEVSTDEILSTAPDKSGRLFRVPPVV
jgi:aspartyl-tRNA(Asn)/glutamyl-tRNA(Gln) amidotransferase subunit C